MKPANLIAAVCAATAFTAHAECVQPHPPGNVPNALLASEREMVTALQVMKQYDASVSAYATCLEQSGIDKAAAADKQSAAQSELQAYSAKFNEQVKIFKRRS